MQELLLGDNRSSVSASSPSVSSATQLFKAEEREHIFKGHGCWNQVQSMPKAKSLMNYLFRLASSSRCQLQEVSCREGMFIIEGEGGLVKYCY